MKIGKKTVNLVLILFGVYFGRVQNLTLGQDLKKEIIFR